MICCKILAGISILNLDSASHEDQAVRKGKFEPGLECKAVPTVPQLASSARRGHAAPENAVFPIDSADTSPSAPASSSKSAPLGALPIRLATTATSRSCAACCQR